MRCLRVVAWLSSQQKMKTEWKLQLPCLPLLELGDKSDNNQNQMLGARHEDQMKNKACIMTACAVAMSQSLLHYRSFKHELFADTFHTSSLVMIIRRHSRFTTNALSRMKTEAGYTVAICRMSLSSLDAKCAEPLMLHNMYLRNSPGGQQCEGHDSGFPDLPPWCVCPPAWRS